MKNFRRIIAVIIAVMMVIPTTVFTVSADTLEDNWTLFGGKYAASSNKYMASKGANGFTMTENASHGIDVHVPNKKEFGNNTAKTPVAYVFNNNTTPLDNLSVTLQVEDGWNFTETYCNSLNVMWNTAMPLTIDYVMEKTGGNNAKVNEENFGASYPALIYGNNVLNNGLRDFVNHEAMDKAILVTVASYNNGTEYTREFEGMVAGKVNIYLFDGEYIDSCDGYGYRWSYMAMNFVPHCANGATVPFWTTNTSINISQGLTVEFVPDTTVGYKVQINGKFYSDGKEVGYFPNNAGSLDNEIDIKGMSEKYLDSMLYKRDDIDLSALVDAGDGYVVAGVTGRANPDVACDFTVVNVNGVPAAQWAGEANTHVHNYVKDTVNSIPATCTTRGYTFYKCACGAVKHPQVSPALKADPAVFGSEELMLLTDDNNKRSWWQDDYPTVAARDKAYLARYYEIMNLSYIDHLSDEDFEDHILGHNYEVTSTTEPTCTAEGVTVSVCSVCGDTKTEVAPALGHTYGLWALSADETARERTCSVCGAVESVVNATSNDPSDYWVAHGKNNLALLENIDDAVILEEGNPNEVTLANVDGDLTVTESRSIVKIGETGEPSSLAVSPVSRVMSKYSNYLNGFHVAVTPVATEKGEYNSAVSFIWTTTPENYDNEREYCTEMYKDNQNYARYGYLWKHTVPNCEYSLIFTVLDKMLVDENNDGVVNAVGEMEIGTADDKVYDAIVYSAVTKGEIWASAFSTCNVPMEDGIDLTIYVDDEGFITYTINGSAEYVAQQMGGSQLATDGYYFGIASDALENSGSSSFIVTDICGQDPATYTGVTPGAEAPQPHVHEYGAWVVTTPATCTAEGIETRTCACGDTQTRAIAALGHNFGDWFVETEATATTDGLKKRVCSRCDAFETEVIPATGEEAPEVYATNYTMTIVNGTGLTAVRFAKGLYDTAGEIKKAPDCVTLSQAVINANLVNGELKYELPDGGIYSVWYKYSNGTEKIYRGLDATKMTVEVSTYGVTATFKNLYGVSDLTVKKGHYSAWGDVKKGYVVQINSGRINNAHNYTYAQALPGEGEYTLAVRYADGSATQFIYFNCEVTHPTVDTYGRNIIVGNLDDVRVVRVAPGTYATSNEVKNATGNRNFNASTIKKLADAEGNLTVLNVVNEDGSDTAYTVAVEYRDLYCEIHNVTVHKKIPTYVISGDSVTFSGLEGLQLFRYAPGTFKTSTGVKSAAGVQTVKGITGDTYTINGLSGAYTFVIQYIDSSNNLINLTV